MYSDTDVIVAPATPMGAQAPLAILRVSGRRTHELVEQCFVPKSQAPSKHWQMRYGHWHDQNGIVDEVMLVTYAAPHSYTGQHMAEIFCHGNPLFIEGIERTLFNLGARRAKPGEFTMRAVLNNKKTLLEAEGLQSLLGAHTRFQADVIRRQASGPLVKFIRDQVEAILQIQAHIEATIDYGEEDIDALEQHKLLDKMTLIVNEFRELKKTAAFLKGMRRGFKVLIAGAPNVGKSTLFNTLVRYERAIVTHLPGTTRDLISEDLEINGLPIVLMDSAGIRETEDLVESLGIEKIFELIHDVDLVLYLATIQDEMIPLDELNQVPREKIIQVTTKADLQGTPPEGTIVVSAHDKRGLPLLEKEIVLRLAADFDTQSTYLINQRQEDIVGEVLNQLEHAIADYQSGFGEEVLSSYLNTIRATLGELTGDTTVEDILDRMFSNFCLGK